MAPTNAKGSATAPSNEAFDRNLRDRNPTWGLRDLEAVAAIAQSVAILGSGGHRNARKQSERGVPPDVILTARLRPANGFVMCGRLLCPIATQVVIRWSRLLTYIRLPMRLD